MNPKPSYQSGIYMIMNDAPGLLVLGCVSFNMDGVEPAFIEPIFQKLNVLCGAEKRRCEIPIGPKPDEVMEYNLSEPS